MKKYALLLVLGLSLSSVAAAQGAAADQPPTREEIQQLLELLGTRAQMTTVMDALAGSIQVQLEENFSRSVPDWNEAQKKEFHRFLDEVMNDYTRAMTIEEMIDIIIPVYVKHLTRSDVQAISAFYSSPVGRKLVALMPVMTTEAMEAVQVALKPRYEKLDQGMDARIAEAMQRIEAAGKSE